MNIQPFVSAPVRRPFRRTGRSKNICTGPITPPLHSILSTPLEGDEFTPVQIAELARYIQRTLPMLPGDDLNLFLSTLFEDQTMVSVYMRAREVQETQSSRICLPFDLAWQGGARGPAGRPLSASGSPFLPLDFKGRRMVPRQGNNSYIFPGVGLGAIACGATRITDEMFLVAAQALAEQVTSADLDQGSLFPPLSNTRAVSARIAVAVAEVAYERGLAAKSRPEDMMALVQAHVYDPHYATYV